MQHIAEHLRAEQDLQTADLFTRRVQEAQKRAALVRQMVLKESPPNPHAVQEDRPGAADEVQ